MADMDSLRRNTDLRFEIDRIIEDMKQRKYPPQYFMRALGWPTADDEELLDSAKALLRNPGGQVAAFEYKRRYGDGLTLEDVVIARGASLAFSIDDIELARHTLGV